MWAWSMIVAAVLILALSVTVAAESADGLTNDWLIVFAAVGFGTMIVGAVFVRFMIAAPSSRLPHATAHDNDRTPPATLGDWRKWTVITGAVIVVGGAASMIFLVAILGEGGTAEGVVVGILAAWGVATLADAHQIRVAQAEEGRRYFALVTTPTAVGRHLVYRENPPTT